MRYGLRVILIALLQVYYCLSDVLNLASPATSKGSTFIMFDSEDEEEHQLHDSEESKVIGNDKGKGKEVADGEDKGCDTPAASLAGMSKRASSGFNPPAAKRSSNFLFAGQSSSRT